jgi:glycosyltransferase involved in cell wall biosynthesis
MNVAMKNVAVKNVAMKNVAMKSVAVPLAVNEVHVVLPNDIDDPATPSGGNVYDRRVCHGLVAAGWSVREYPVRGGWPWPGASERDALDRVLAALPDDALVLLDGLVASAAPDELGRHGRRLRLVVLVHMPLGEPRERDALAAAAAVVTTSDWSRRRLLDRYALTPHRVHVAHPGVDPAPLTRGSARGSALLCVAAVTRPKGHDVLVRALAMLDHRDMHCVCAGTLDRDPAFVADLRRSVADLRRSGADRVSLVGPLSGAALADRYAAADLLVLPSRAETYGMVVTEALARGTPVLVSDVDGVPEAVGRAPDGRVPGLLVPPDDPVALAAALRRWLDEPALRAELRSAARARRATLTGWSVTAATIASRMTLMSTKVRVGR